MSAATESLARYEQRTGWCGGIPEGHYAVVDPHESERTTMWRVKSGVMAPWPRKARQGPVAYRKDAPRDGEAREAWIREWAACYQSYRDEVEQCIASDPEKAAARYASVTFRCALCNRALLVPESNAYGVGPECRSWMPDELLARFARQVSVVRAELGGRGDAP